jgi:ABC-type uncharacterized transport system substrate-binding protein
VASFVRAATSTIPIIMVVSVDPVQSGLVASLARPGGNITGVTFVSSDLAAKRLQFLREMAPNLAQVAVIWNPDHIDPEYREMQAAAKSLGIIQSLEVRTVSSFQLSTSFYLLLALAPGQGKVRSSVMDLILTWLLSARQLMSIESYAVKNQANFL